MLAPLRGALFETLFSISFFHTALVIDDYLQASGNIFMFLYNFTFLWIFISHLTVRFHPPISSLCLSFRFDLLFCLLRFCTVLVLLFRCIRFRLILKWSITWFWLVSLEPIDEATGTCRAYWRWLFSRQKKHFGLGGIQTAYPMITKRMRWPQGYRALLQHYYFWD